MRWISGRFIAKAMMRIGSPHFGHLRGRLS
jgi:hypothetical protein